MSMQEKVVAKGKIFELVQIVQPNGQVFEIARRAPGVRVIVADKAARKVLLTKEFRRELNQYDYRLPGGKVFNTLDEFEAHRQSGEGIVAAAKNQAKQEAAEEAGIDITALQLVQKSTLGTTVEWDLYVFETINWQPHQTGQQLQENEVQDIEGAEFYAYEEAERMIFHGDMQEERIALILLKWINAQKEERSNEI